PTGRVIRSGSTGSESSKMLHVVLWKWNQPGYRERFTSEHVNVMGKMLRRHMNGYRHRVVCVTDNSSRIDPTIDTFPLWNNYNHLPNASGRHLPSCYRRLKIFDPVTQREMGINPGDRVMSIDLDMVIARDLRPLVTRQEPFVGWAVRGTVHPRVFNGSMFMFTAGEFEEVWTSFHPELSPRKAFKLGYFGSDQAWLSFNLSKR